MKRNLIFPFIIWSLICAGCGSAVQSAIQKNGDDQLGRAFAERASNVQVEGEGVVSRILADDLDGSRHQRFIIQLASGQTILIAHNIDIAPRVNGLAKGDTVRFYGEYIWNEKGGTVHWTHRDPQGKHTAGWLKYRGQTYQ